ncbi:C1 family peptidase [Flavobacterium sp. N1994]|uniref:C1 family peptidase n=1 Tax=Flavobacterium sp. N1994 TaxID=2986827 RepID=UPI002222BB49|nr:C1 family peptidase [Flavobacterium sp. N1994]
MNKSIIYVASLFLSFTGIAQTYEFHTIKDIEATPVISQDKTGTCWSFATTSFLEAEIIRLTGKKIDLSEMYNVRNTYLDKAENYVMRQGKAQFGEGGLSHDVINSAKKYGVVPESNFIGKTNPDLKYNHNKMEAELEVVVKKAVAETPKKYPNWKADYATILDTYMGKFNEEDKIILPNQSIDNKEASGEKAVTPKQFLSTTKLNLDDYITITSYINQPFYSKFILNIPDNFANGIFYNLPLDEFMQNIDNAITKGFTVALDTDVSEATFSEENGIAVIPENAADSETILKEIKPEKNITPEYRQAEFENYDTQDDHLMHIVGKVEDQKGDVFYKVKNSWGANSGRDGFMYMSVSYLRLKSISVMLHKDGLTKKTKAALRV